MAKGYPTAQVVWKQLKNKVGPTAGNLLLNSKNFLIDNTVSAFVDSNVISGNPSALGQMTQQYHLIRSGPHYQVFENGSLRISEVNSILDSTNYLCQASNGVGPGLSKMVALKVNGKLLLSFDLISNSLIILSFTQKYLRNSNNKTNL